MIVLCIVSFLQIEAKIPTAGEPLHTYAVIILRDTIQGGKTVVYDPISLANKGLLEKIPTDGLIMDLDYWLHIWPDQITDNNINDYMNNQEGANTEHNLPFYTDGYYFFRCEESYYYFNPQYRFFVTGIKKDDENRVFHCNFKMDTNTTLGRRIREFTIVLQININSSLIPDELTMYTEETQEIVPQVPVLNAHWESSNESVVAITNPYQSPYKIEGLSEGKSTVTLSGKLSDIDIHFSTDCKVTVKSSKKTVNLKKAGTLSNSNNIDESEKYHIKDLTIKGELNGTDLRLLREMAGNNHLGELTEGRLYKLDLSGVSIVEGGKKYLDTNNGIHKTNNELVGGEHHYGVDKANEIGDYLFACCPKLKTVILPPSITSICNNAFYHCGSLESISLPDRLEKIGEHAFRGCKNLSMVELPNSLNTLGRFAFADDHNLRNINIPESITIIDDYTFDGCNSLNSIELPESLNKIGLAAFRKCNSLQRIFIPRNVNNIESDAFSSCTNLEEIIVDSNNEWYSDIDGVLFSNNQRLIQYPAGKEDWQYIIPEGVSLSSGAFWGNKYLVNIVLPQSLTELLGHTFEDCISLSEITIPEHVLTLWSSEFSGCTKLRKITSEIKDPTSVKYYPDEYFYSWNALFDDDTYNNATLYVPYGTKQLYKETRDWKKFKNIVEMEGSLVTQIVLNVTNKEITERQTFQLSATVSPNNATNKSVTWSSSNASIASVDNTGLVSAISVGNAIITCEAQDGSGVKATCNITVNAAAPCILFADAEVKRICVQKWDADNDGELSEAEAANVQALGYAFGLSSITTFEELRYFTGLTTIDEHAFDRCPNLQSVTLPAQVTSIGRAAFSACSSLTSITLPEGLTSISELCFERCTGLKSINIPASVSSIGNNAFYACYSLEEIVSEIAVPFDIDASVFTNSIYTSARLCVPKGTKSKYRNALGWKNFKNIIEDGLEEAEINVISIEIVGDGIVGTPHNYAIKLENAGSVDFTGTLYVWIYKESEQIESYSVSYNGGIPASDVGILSSERDFFLNPPGTYYIWLTTDADGKNILGNKKAFIVTPAATLTAGNYTRIYGDENPEFKFTADKGGYNGTPQISCKATADSPVGTYDVVITQGSVDNNFVNYVNGTLTITKAPLTIMAGSYTKKQGEENPEFTLTYKGFKNGETEAVLTKKPIVTTTADWNSPVGIFDVFVSGAEAQNYEINYVAGTLTIEKRPKGDLDAKGYTDVTDVVAAINHVLGERTLNYDEKELLDMNNDGELNVGDVILLVKNILEQGNQFEVPTLARGDAETIDLTQYTAMQLNVNVPTGCSIRDIRLAGSNSSTHSLAYQQTGDNRYAVVVYSMGNQTFKPDNGCLLEVITDGDGEPVTANVLLATPTGERKQIGSLPNVIVTGIRSIYSDQTAAFSIYDLRGNKVLDKGMSIQRLPMGLYIMNGKKIIK